MRASDTQQWLTQRTLQLILTHAPQAEKDKLVEVAKLISRGPSACPECGSPDVEDNGGETKADRDFLCPACGWGGNHAEMVQDAIEAYDA